MSGDRLWRRIHPGRLTKASLHLSLTATGDKKWKTVRQRDTWVRRKTSRVAWEVYSLSEYETFQHFWDLVLCSMSKYFLNPQAKWWTVETCQSTALSSTNSTQCSVSQSMIWLSPCPLCGIMILTGRSSSHTLLFMTIWKILQCSKNFPDYLVAGELL